MTPSEGSKPKPDKDYPLRRREDKDYELAKAIYNSVAEDFAFCGLSDYEKAIYQEAAKAARLHIEREGK